MGEVYQHAILQFCNIAATGALDSTKGLFFDKSHVIQPCKVQIHSRQS